eukprot:CAMPEP_0172417082 /NCGR_PEP_ID=MMETSP1064-20121228/3578_1 /TAXON_ID=202472 /ORGANISM="Aulacoseira subarctica , Strain CCAP 1002/5" /LENGTH=309 /DNA_ID=CAMNT_0013155169 /DNA_START=114 /DNA_END=1040 /DNA_ORIENTATION=+
MKTYLSTPLLLVLISSANAAFHVHVGSSLAPRRLSRVVLKGYLDDLTNDLKEKPKNEYDAETESLEATMYDRSKIDRYGPGTFKEFTDFSDEFDGGDGQMGVSGDGEKGLEKIGAQPTLAKSLNKSKMMSAKNAWGTSTGYAEKLLEEKQGMDVARAQQLENWQNQREVWQKNQFVKKMEIADDIKQGSAEADWRTLAKFGVERNQDFSLEEVFGDVRAGEKLEDTVEMKSMVGKPAAHTIKLKNEYMGFADFRAAFTYDSSPDFVVTPPEGSISSKEATEFLVKFKPSALGVSEAWLVIETEDFKKTW